LGLGWKKHFSLNRLTSTTVLGGRKKNLFRGCRSVQMLKFVGCLLNENKTAHPFFDF
jgi:hypothetical protein